jgi:pimeloyl-ACP methyl ester carboxylesterase
MYPDDLSHLPDSSNHHELTEKRGRIRAGAVELEYAWFGPPPSADVPTVVFLHEGLGSLGLWKDFPAVVCARTGCSGLVYSRAGHGESDPFMGRRSVRFMHDEALLVLPEVLDRFGIAGPILVGHSDGASIALILAGSGKRHVTGLVLEAPHVFVEDLTISSISAIKRRFDEGDLRAKLHRHHKNSDALFQAWTDVWLSSTFREWNIEEYVRQVDAPTLLIQGVNDEYGTMRQIDAIAGNTRGRWQKVILPKCGHAPHIHRRRTVERITARFIQWLMESRRRNPTATWKRQPL